MGKALVKGCIFGGVIVFAWMMVSWMVLPWHCWTLKSFDQNEQVAEALMNNASEDGMYLLPSICGATTENIGEKLDEMNKGPYAFISLNRYGHDVNAVQFILALIFQLIGALIITYLILHTHALNYFKKVWLITLIGFLIGFLPEMASWNWWGFSFGYVVVGIADSVIAWFLGGLAIAAVAKR